MVYQVILGALAVLIGFVGYGFYIQGILAGKVKPHAFSWLVWGILTAVGFFAQIVGGGGPGTWVTGFTAAMSFVFFIVGLGSSSRALITRSDWIFFIGALLAIPPWYLTGNPLWSVIIITVIDAIAYIPTFRKAYQDPDTESLRHSSLQCLKFIFGIIALKSFSLVTMLYPASLVLANGAFVAMLALRRSRNKAL